MFILFFHQRTVDLAHEPKTAFAPTFTPCSSGLVLVHFLGLLQDTKIVQFIKINSLFWLTVPENSKSSIGCKGLVTFITSQKPENRVGARRRAEKNPDLSWPRPPVLGLLLSALSWEYVNKHLFAIVTSLADVIRVFRSVSSGQSSRVSLKVRSLSTHVTHVHSTCKAAMTG